jgi:hypothetical protein
MSEANVERHEVESLLGGQLAVEKKHIVPLWLEIVLYVGLIAVSAGLVLVANVSDPNDISVDFARAILYVYYTGTIIVSISGFGIVVLLRKHEEFIWFFAIYVGSIFSLWNLAVDSWFDTQMHTIFYILTCTGCIFMSVGVSRITICRRWKYRWIVKLTFIIGLTLCHIVSIVDILGYRVIPLCVGIGLCVLAYIIAHSGSSIKETCNKS